MFEKNCAIAPGSVRMPAVFSPLATAQAASVNVLPSADSVGQVFVVAVNRLVIGWSCTTSSAAKVGAVSRLTLTFVLPTCVASVPPIFIMSL